MRWEFWVCSAGILTFRSATGLNYLNFRCSGESFDYPHFVRGWSTASGFEVRVFFSFRNFGFCSGLPAEEFQS